MTKKHANDDTRNGEQPKKTPVGPSDAILLVKAEKALFKAAKSINQRIDRGDFRPDPERIAAARAFRSGLDAVAKNVPQAKELLKHLRELDASEASGWTLRIGKIERTVLDSEATLAIDPCERNKAVYKLTTRVCRKGFYLSPSGATVDLLSPEESFASSIFYADPGTADGVSAIDAPTRVEVVNADCIDVASRLIAAGENPILLNMASNRRPGGGVLRGSGAQEETIFRRSTAHLALYPFHEESARRFGLVRSERYYPMKRDTGGIYSGKVMFFRSGAADGYQFLEKPFTCSLVTVAAEINRDRDVIRLPSWMADLQRNKIRTIFRIGLLNGHRTFVLSAFGCGVFGNPPDQMAGFFRDVLEEPEFRNKCRRVLFAISDDHNTGGETNPDGNFLPFARLFPSEQADV